MHINKIANAFYKDAIPIKIIPGHSQPEESFGNRYKKKNGGLWVGGRVLITNESIKFKANNLNKMFHEELNEVALPMKEIISATFQYSWFTGIVLITHSMGSFKFRCFGARKLVKDINSYISKL